MSNHTLPEDTLVVITTGAEAKLFRNKAGNGEVRLAAAGMLSPRNLAGDGPAGKRPPESSERETDEATFSKQLANELYRRAHAGRFEHLALVADPDTLGELRPILHQEVTDKIVLELAKTLINSPTEDIEAALARG